MAEQIGNYKILKKIGAGGMAQVYLAVHQDVPNLKVVLKVLSDPRLVERFKQEADKLALLDGNGHICQIKHFFNHGDNIVIAMEYIDGSTLEDIIKEKGNIPVETAAQIISSVLDTLAFAHQKGIYHRDIKPGNIMVDKQGNVKIIDFGIAKGESDPNLTIAGSSCGTPTYMPPEQFNPTEDINYALADIYAIGTTLFFMLTGQLPFTGDNAFALRDAKLFNEPIKPRDLNPDIPKPLEEIILTSISREPNERYESVEAMKQAIDSLGFGEQKADLTEHISISKDKTPTPPPPSRKAKRNFLPIIIAGAAVVIVAIVAFFMFTGKKEVHLLAPILIAPANNDTLSDATPVFQWKKQPGLGYTLEIADDINFTTAQKEANLTVPQFKTPVEMADGHYYWRVISSDADGNLSPYSPIWEFTIQTIQDTTPVSAEGKLEIVVVPKGDIFIDDKPYGQKQKALSVTLPKGQHVVRIVNKAATQKAFTDTIQIETEQTTRMKHVFTIPPPKPQTAYGEIRIGSKPYIGAVIFIDGQVQDRKTNNTFKVKAGRHVIKAVLSIDGVEHEKTDTVRVKKNGSHKLIFDFEK